MTKLVFAATAALAFTSNPVSAATSVATTTRHGYPSLSYDATTATMTAIHNTGIAELSSSASPLRPTNQSAVATLKINFDAPLLRTDEVVQTEWTASGHRNIASFVRGTAIGFEYIVNSLPDGNGISTNLLTVKSQPGFSVPFVSLDQLSYYYDFNGNTRGGGAFLYSPYQYYYDFVFIGLFPPCNCVDGYRNVLGPAITEFTATSDLGDYVQNIFFPSNAFRLNVYGTGYDLWDVTASSTSVANSFTVYSTAEWSPSVPEPASWAMMIAGFGLVGTSLRHQRRLMTA